MKLVEWFLLSVSTMIALAGISQVPLVQDVVTSTGYSSAEVFSGIGTVLMFFFVLLAVFTVRN